MKLDFFSILNTLWSRRYLILGVTFLFMTAGIIYSASIRPTYTSSAFFQYKCEIEGYYPALEILSSNTHFEAYRAYLKGQNPAYEDLSKYFTNSDTLKEIVSPVYQNMDPKVRNQGSIVGLSIRITSPFPKHAQQQAEYAADVIRDALLRRQVLLGLQTQKKQTFVEMQKKREVLLATESNIRSYPERIANTRALAKKMPQGGVKLDAPQGTNSEWEQLYLPPETQVLGYESTLIQLKQQQQQLLIQIRYMESILQLYDQALSACNSARTGKECVAQFMNTLAAYSSNPKADEYVHAELASTLTEIISGMENIGLVAPPVLPITSNNNRRIRVVYLAVCCGFLLSCVFVLARRRYSAWRQQNSGQDPQG